jgi:hypothetical protein
MVPRSRKSEYASRDDKGEGGASIGLGCRLSEPQVLPLRFASVLTNNLFYVHYTLNLPQASLLLGTTKWRDLWFD